MNVLYEDNHLIIVNKAPGEITQGDKTGDEPLVEAVKRYIKERYHKPGNVFLGVVHRLDRPTSGIVIMARTSKALSRMNQLFRNGGVRKTYHALLCAVPHAPRATLDHQLVRNERQNKSYVSATGGKRAVLDYTTLGRTERYTLVEVRLHTGRHHQIRCQFAHIGCPIRGDLKYGAPRSNRDGSISLHARNVEFEHPVTHQPVHITAPYPPGSLFTEAAGTE